MDSEYAAGNKSVYNMTVRIRRQHLACLGLADQALTMEKEV